MDPPDGWVHLPIRGDRRCETWGETFHLSQSDWVSPYGSCLQPRLFQQETPVTVGMNQQSQEGAAGVSDLRQRLSRVETRETQRSRIPGACNDVPNNYIAFEYNQKATDTARKEMRMKCRDRI